MPQIDPDGVLPQQDKIFISKPFRNLRFHLPQYNGYKTAINDIIRVRIRGCERFSLVLG